MGCLSELEAIEDPYPFEKDGELWTGFSLVKYSSLASQALKLCKYQGYEQLFNSLLHYLIRLQRFEGLLLEFKDATWVPVPLHWIRQRERGFNQAELVARACQKAFGGEIVLGLVRPKENLSLTTQNLKERQLRSQGVFKRKIHSLKNVIIVDDLITTGATLHAAMACFHPEEFHPEIQFLTAFQGLGNLTSDYEIERKLMETDPTLWR